MGVEVGRARLAFEFGDGLAGAVVVAATLQRERQQRASVRLQLGALRKQVIDVTRFGLVRFVAAHVERVDQIGARFGIDRLAVFELARVEQFFDALAPATDRVAVDGVAGAASERQPVNYVGRHKRIGLIVLPPAPAAVVVLEAVKAVKPPLNLRVQIVRRLDRSRLHVLQRLRDDHVRQEAGHRLFDATVRVAGQIIERAEHRPGYRRRGFYAKPSGLRIGVGGQVERERPFSRLFGDRGGGACGPLQALRDDGQLQLDGVRLFVGPCVRGQSRLAELRGRDAPVDALLAVFRDRYSLLRRVEQVRALYFQIDLHGPVSIEIVVNDAGDRDNVAFGHKFRSFGPHYQILARKDAADDRTDAQVAGHRASRG